MNDPRLVGAWDAVAPGYLDYWVPRFRPWLEDAARLLAEHVLADGPVAVPGCGPGEELLLLRARLPGRELVALDPAPGMLALLRARAPQVRAVQADADELPAKVRAAAGVLSCFTLQLLPDKLAARAAWGRALAPGAPLVVLFWPRQEDATPWGRLGAAQAQEGLPRPDWEPDVRAGLSGAGLALEHDRDARHAMAHASPEEAWERLVDSGSLQALARRVDAPALARVRARWLAEHGLRREGAAWTHAPVARLWLLRRR